jgi:cytochrome c oxidase cbb3-type subunit 3
MKWLVIIVVAWIGVAAAAMAQSESVTPDSPNPLSGNGAAAAQGKLLFGQMNCAGCHAYDLTGGMGPDLTDDNWLYGGKPGEIFHTIAEGTPRGMPTWKDKLTAEQIWQLVTYIQSRHAAP